MKRAIALLIATVTLGSAYGGGCSLIPGFGKPTLKLNPIEPVAEVVAM